VAQLHEIYDDDDLLVSGRLTDEISGTYFMVDMKDTYVTLVEYFDVLLAVHLNIFILILTNLMH
jgi:hypothetical protein